MRTLKGKLEEYAAEIWEELDDVPMNLDDELELKIKFDFDGNTDIKLAIYQRVKVPVRLEDEQ